MIRVTWTPPKRKPQPADLFAPGAAWLRWAESWASSEGLAIERWSVDQRILVGGVWHAVLWDEADGWRVAPCEAGNAP